MCLANVSHTFLVEDEEVPGHRGFICKPCFCLSFGADNCQELCLHGLQCNRNRYDEAVSPTPTEDTWREIANGFWEKWNFPNCLGALDGKHVQIEKPANSGSQYFNYLKFFSIVLLALVDADYRFRVIHVGDYGRSSDGGVYAGSALGIGMEGGTLHVPPNAPLPGAVEEDALPYVMVADAAFPLKTYMMRPYPGPVNNHHMRIYNYRLSRARMVVENAFGILATRWRVLYTRISVQPKNVDAIVIACCILHNYLLSPTDNVRLMEEAEAHGRRMRRIGNVGGHRTSNDARAVRQKFCEFFNSPEGSVHWQDRMRRSDGAEAEPCAAHTEDVERSSFIKTAAQLIRQSERSGAEMHVVG
ncbi:hypothetical protein WMY93_017289 [Mugilogobius chulae]|uniref:DDE Tnp4 domain-containing protein n=1 Tax=Mugilogobius chulae TaxID=88201 RepID=A0AAW0NYU8_9GOBI